jgi:trans-2,3-dihydro-3-hydroxyanthranilate isomerase
MNKRRVLILDAFTDRPFLGNPCGVVPDAEGLSDDEMQKIAREMNLPETSFVLKSDKADFRVRYFTPRYELGFAGHPTIATSYMLALEGMTSLDKSVNTIQLEFNIGVLPVDLLAENGTPKSAVMTQSTPEYGDQVEAKELAACFRDLDESDFAEGVSPQVVGTGTKFLIASIKSLDKLANLEMNRDKLCETVDRVGVSAAYIFTPYGFDRKTGMHGRLRDPRGTFEDPFTGAAVGAAGAYMVRYGLTDREEIKVEQGNFVDRPGLGTLFIHKDGNRITSVKLGGCAVKVSDGYMLLD